MTGATVNPERGVASGLTLDVWWDQKEYMHVVYKTTTTAATTTTTTTTRSKNPSCARAMHTRTPESHAWPRIFVCLGRVRISLPGWAVHLRLRMHSPLYGQCRSINNATLAEVKAGLRVWRRRSGEAEEGQARQRERGDGQTAETFRDKKETNVSL